MQMLKVSRYKSMIILLAFFLVPAQVSTYVINGNKTLKEGGNVSLYCNASGSPDPTVTWLKVGVTTSFSRNSSFHLTNISRYDKGSYICIGNNTCGKENSSVIDIDVLCKGIPLDLFN